jgi:predicted RNA polymerase sigma factor
MVHPVLSEASQLALTLRAVGGLTTVEIAHAFMVPEATMTQRLVRARQTLRSSAVPFGGVPAAERVSRLRVVRHVLYLIFNEGYVATTGPYAAAFDGCQCGVAAPRRPAVRRSTPARRVRPAIASRAAGPR